MADNFLRRLKNTSILSSLEKRINGLEDSLEAVPCLLSELVRCLDQFLKLNVDLAVCFEAIFADTSLDNLVTNFKHAQVGVISSINHFMNVHSCKPLEKISRVVEDVKVRKKTYISCLEEYRESKRSFDAMCKDRRYSQKKLDNAEQALAASGEHCSRQDAQMSDVLDNLSRTTLEVAGPVFFTLVEGQIRLVNHLSAVMSPFGASSEAGMLLAMPPNHPSLSEAVAQWLSVHHSPQQLLAVEGLSRTDLQALVRCKQDGLASQLKTLLNNKVDLLLEKYLRELKSSSALSFNLLGGFHNKPSVIQSILKDCCTNAEAKAAGASLPLTEQEQDAQIMQDIPYMMLSVASQQFRVATSSRDCVDNFKQKQLAIFNIISECASDIVPVDMVDLFTHRVLLELCSSVTLTASRTAVQLIFGKANLIAVCPSQNPDDVAPVEISSTSNGGIKIITRSTWWLVEDYTTLAPLRMPPKMPTPLGAVDVIYTQELSLENFVEHSGLLELPEINVAYRLGSSPVDYPPTMAESKHRRSWAKVDDIRGLAITDDIDSKSDCSNKTGSTVMSRRKSEKLASKSSYSSIHDSNLPYTRSIGGSSGSISSATTLTGKHRTETDDPYQFLIQSSSRTSYLNPLRLQEHTHLEAEKAGRGGSWKGHRHKHNEDDSSKNQRDSNGQLPFIMGIDHSSSEDLAEEDFSASRRFSDQGWSTGSSQEVNHSLSNSSLNESELPQIPQTRASSFHQDHHHGELIDSRPVIRSSRPGSKKKPGESGISIDSGITSSDNSQENNIPTSTYIPGLESKPNNGNIPMSSRARLSNSFVPPTSQYGSYYDGHSSNFLSTPNPDSSSDEQDEEMLGIRLKLTEEKWDNILNSDRDTVPTFSRIPKATSSENLGLDVAKSRNYDPWGSTQSLDAMEMREARNARINPMMDGRLSEPFIQQSLSQDAPINHPRQLSDAGNYMLHSQESLESYPLDDQGLPPRSTGSLGYDQFGPPVRNYPMGPGRPSRHKEFSPGPNGPMDPGISPQKLPFHSGPPPNHWQQNHLPMMNRGPPPNRHPPPWEQGGFRPIPPPPGYENPSPGPSPGPSPRPTPPPTPPPPNHPNHMMMGHPPPPHHQRPHSAPMNRIPMGMPPPRQPLPPFWDQGNPPPMGPPRPGGPFMGRPPPPLHGGRFPPPNFQHDWDEWSQR